jgi:hypothetical protein
MRRYPFSAAIAVGAAAVLLAGCSSGSDKPASGTASSAQLSSSPATTMTTETHTAAPGGIGVSPNGVTTAVGAPAESTEDEYFQACRAAKAWMTEKGGDAKAQFEPYLQSLQTSDSAGPGTFGSPWSQLAPGRQSAVVVAAEAAADALCG